MESIRMRLVSFYMVIFWLLMLCLQPPKVAAQTITHGDGSALMTQYCWENKNFSVTGQPAGGTFSGCGVLQQGGQWYFNPVIATQNITVFPLSCNLVYTVNGTSVTVPILIWKPVVITPPLADTFTCNGHFLLHANTLYAGAYDFTWSPAAPLEQPAASNTAGYISAGQTFVLTAVDNTSGCIGSDTVRVEKYPVPVIGVSNDTLINARKQVQLQAWGADTYRWLPPQWLDSDTIANPLAAPQAPVTYQVVGRNAYGCTDTAKVFINIRETLLVPNAFSPNGDGINDQFCIANFGYQKVEEFQIFNRWGQRIFQTLDGAKGWDGTHNGLPMESGSYFYAIRLVERDGSVKILKGDIALIR